MNIDSHDLKVRHNKIFKFLSKQYIVKYILEVGGRQKNMLDQAREDYNKNIESFCDVATWSEPQVSYGRMITVSTTLMPIRK